MYVSISEAKLQRGEAPCTGHTTMGTNVETKFTFSNSFLWALLIVLHTLDSKGSRHKAGSTHD